MKKILFFIGMAVLLVLCAGCGKPEAANAPKELTELHVGVMPDTDSLPIIIAQEKGFFAAEGLKVDIQQFKSAMDRDSALQSGNLDGAVSDMLAVAFAKSGGFDVKVTSSTDGSYKLIAGKGENISRVQDLTGRDVAVSKNTIIEYVTDQVLASAQLSGESINKVVIPQIPTRLEMLQNGSWQPLRCRNRWPALRCTMAASTLPVPMHLASILA